MMLQKSLLALALLGGSTAALAAPPPPGKLKPKPAQIDYLISVYDTDTNVIDQGNKPLTHIVKLGKARAISKSSKGPAPYAHAQVIDSATAQGSAQTVVSYDYVFRSKTQAAFDNLSAYAAAHDGTISVIKGIAKLSVFVNGYALASADAGAATIASYTCTNFGGDCNNAKKAPHVFKFVLPGKVSESDADDMSFLGHLTLSTSASSFGPKGRAYSFIDPEIGLPDDFGGSLADYSFELSEGVGNAIGSGDVPEPASWMMLIAGFGVIGAAARRRRTVAA